MDVQNTDNEKKPIDKIDFLLSLSRIQLLDLVRKASYVELFQKSSNSVANEINNQKLAEFKKTEKNHDLQQQKQSEILKLNFETEKKKISKLEKFIKILEHYRTLGFVYAVLGFLLFFPLFILVALIVWPFKIPFLYTTGNPTGLVLLVGALIILGWFAFNSWRQQAIPKFKQQLADLKVHHRDSIPSIDSKYHELVVQTALKTMEPNQELFAKYTELRNSGIESEGYRIIFPQTYQNLASLQLLASFLQDGLATTWKEAALLYKSEENVKRLEKTQMQVAQTISRSINKNSQQVISALDDLKESNENGRRMMLAQANEAQAEERYMQAGIYGELKYANDRRDGRGPRTAF